MSLSSRLQLLATRIGSEFKSVRGYSPLDYGLLGWTARPEDASSALVLTAATATMIRMKVAAGGSCGAVKFSVSTAAVLPVGSRIQIYSLAGVLLAQTGDISSQLTSTGDKSAALTAPTVLSVGQEVLVVLYTLTGTGASLRATTAAAALNMGLTSSSPYRASRKTGVTVDLGTVVATDYSTALTQIPLLALGA